MPDGATVSYLRYVAQAVDLERACGVAARTLRTNPTAVHRFIALWGSNWLGAGWLLGEVRENLRGRPGGGGGGGRGWPRPPSLGCLMNPFPSHFRRLCPPNAGSSARLTHPRMRNA